MSIRHQWHRWVLSLGLLVALAMAGCGSAPRVEDYVQEKPHLSLRDYFNGKLTAHGIFTDRAGKVVKRFTVHMKATWQGQQGVLEEDFVYSDGSVQRRVWTLTDHGNGRYEGRADDVVGVAQGHAAGNALQWQYTLALPVDGTVYQVQFDDWMFLMNDRVMLNRARMSKFGIHLGDVTLAFEKALP
jgi:Protein of unknown function (DUF3833)